MNIDLLFLIHFLVGLQQGNDHCCLVVVSAEESEDIRDVNVPPYLYIYIYTCCMRVCQDHTIQERKLANYGREFVILIFYRVYVITWRSILFNC